MSSTVSWCPVCRNPVSDDPRAGNRDILTIRCPRCTPYDIEWDAKDYLDKNPFDPQTMGAVSGWLRDGTGITITYASIDRLRKMRPLPVGEQA